jgi:flagellar protein FliO/FliZ
VSKTTSASLVPVKWITRTPPAFPEPALPQRTLRITAYALRHACFKIANSIPSWPTLLLRYLKPLAYHPTFNACWLLCALFSRSTLAQTALPEPPGLSLATMLQSVLGLALVIAVLFLAAYFLRRLNGGRGFGSNGPMRVVGGLIIGSRERIVLVEIGDTWLVVGLVPGQIRTLHTLPKGELPAAGDGEKPFSQWLKQVAERRNEGR